MDVGSLNFMRVEQALNSHRPRCSCTEITACTEFTTCTEITVCAEFTACMEISDPRLSYVQTGMRAELYIRKIIPHDTSIPLPEHLALSGRGYALFARVRGMGILGSSAIVQNQVLGSGSSQLRSFLRLTLGVYF